MKGRLVEHPKEPIRKPSVFRYSLFGYLIATALGIPAVVVLSLRAGDYHEQGAFELLVCAGAFGAIIGFEIAAKRLKAFGSAGMAEEWKRFWGSLPCYGLAAIIIGGSILITFLGTLIAIAVMGQPPTKQ
jgi:hypothetical protein